MNQSMAIMNEMVRLSKLTNQPAIIKEMEDAYGNVMKKYQGN
jgi:anionic cell wall polymer biosynthesis LytR-Cps2A-Psr (LCP) family protein